MFDRALLAGAFVLLACSCGARDEDESYPGDASATRVENSRSNLEGETYESMHGGEGCTSDCSGHDAGYQWAQDNEVQDASECSGDSDSFVEGCEAYANDLEDGAENDGDEYSRDIEE